MSDEEKKKFKPCNNTEELIKDLQRLKIPNSDIQFIIDEAESRRDELDKILAENPIDAITVYFSRRISALCAGKPISIGPTKKTQTKTSDGTKRVPRKPDLAMHDEQDE